MKIISFEAENVKKLTCVHIEPTSPTVVIGGKNGAGKSTTLDCIMYALGGAKGISDNPIQDGQDEAIITLDVGKYKFIRKFKRTADGYKSTLKVENEDGGVFAGAQKFLNDICGPISFDPLAYISLKPKEQLETLQGLVGVNFDTINQERKDVFNTRTITNGVIRDLLGQLNDLPLNSKAPDEEVSVSELANELEENRAHNLEMSGAAQRHLNLVNTSLEIEAKINVLKNDIYLARKSLAVQEKAIKEAARKIDAMEEKPTVEILDQIEAADEINQNVRDKKARENVKKLIIARTKEADAFTTELAAIDKKKAATMKKAKMPVKGLEFGDDGVIYEGHKLEDICSGDQTRISTAMGLAMNPTLKVLLIRGGSLLDDDNLEMMRSMAEKADAQIWIERVGNGSEIEFLLEEGELKDATKKRNSKKRSKATSN